LLTLRQALFALALFSATPFPALAEGQGVVVTVNDQPITTFDIRQRQKLMTVFGSPSDRKKALQSLIDDVVKLSEAKKLNVQPTDKMVDDQIAKMGKGNPENFLGQFKKQGISKNAVRRFISSQIAFQRLYRAKNPDKQIAANQADVDREYKEVIAKYNKAANDPRLKPITVYSIQEIVFPVEKADEALAGQLLQARAVETQIFLKRFKGCKSARAAAEGIYNVKVGKIIEADASKIPKPLKAALDKAGPGKAFGPARAPEGLQVLGFCGKRTIKPQKIPPPPTREQVERSVESRAFDAEEDVFMASLRNNAVIDYKDKSASQ
jgi:peptidyl-prolyl cis-trans isomerase SurA